MPTSAKSDPRIPGPATKPVGGGRGTHTDGPVVDPVLDPAPAREPEGTGVSAIDRAATDDAGPGPLAADDPRGQRAPAGQGTPDALSPDPLGPLGPFGPGREAGAWGDEALEGPDDPSGRTPPVDAFIEEEDDMYDDELHGDSSDDGDGLIAQGAGMIRRNPVGTGLVLAGLALLAAPRLERDTVRHHYDGVRSSARARVDGNRRKAQSQLRALRERLSDGTEGMSDEARDRVVAARRRALEMKERASAGMRSATARADGTLRDHPMVAGALALAAGAALGAALPRTQAEDSRIGQLSDRLMDEARAVFDEERARLTAGAHAAADEMRSMAREAAQATRDAVPDGTDVVARSKDALRGGVGRVATAAKHAADASSSRASDA